MPEPKRRRYERIASCLGTALEQVEQAVGQMANDASLHMTPIEGVMVFRTRTSDGSRVTITIEPKRPE